MRCTCGMCEYKKYYHPIFWIDFRTCKLNFVPWFVYSLEMHIMDGQNQMHVIMKRMVLESSMKILYAELELDLHHLSVSWTGSCRVFYFMNKLQSCALSVYRSFCFVILNMLFDHCWCQIKVRLEKNVQSIVQKLFKISCI